MVFGVLDDGDGDPVNHGDARFRRAVGAKGRDERGIENKRQALVEPGASPVCTWAVVCSVLINSPQVLFEESHSLAEN